MTPEYVRIIRDELKLEISDESLPSSNHQDLKCLICGNVFNATPKAKMQKIKRMHKTGESEFGCPACYHDARYAADWNHHKERIEGLGYKILDGFPIVSNKQKLLVTNLTCEHGHSWWVKIENLLNREPYCKPCNDILKANKFREFNNLKREEYLKTATGFKKYKSEVRFLSERTYRNNITIINPNNYPRVLAKAGTKGYQLDHIVPIRYCFDHHIPIEICAHISNIRIIEWKENISKNNSFNESEVPEIFLEFIQK